MIADGRARRDRGGRRVERENLAVDGELAQPARDQLRELRAEIENQDGLMGQCGDPLEGTRASMDANSSIIAVLTPCGYASSACHRIRVLLRAHLPDPAGLRPARSHPLSASAHSRRPVASAAPGRAPAARVDTDPATDARSGARRAAGGPSRVRRDDGVSAAQGRPPGRHRPALGTGALGQRAGHDLGAERRRPAWSSWPATSC